MLPQLNSLPRSIKRLANACFWLGISGSEQLRDRYLDFKLKSLTVEQLSKSLVKQIDSYNQTEKSLIDKWSKARSEESRIQLQKDIEYLRGLREQYKTSLISTKYIEKYSAYEKIPDEKEEVSEEDLSGVWIDVFVSFARKNNEPWRKELLGKALAFNSAHPGFMRQRALWLIGTMDYEIYLALKEFLPFCTQVDKDFIFPSTEQEDYYTPQKSITSGKHKAIGNLCYILQEQSLVGSEVVSCSILPNTPTIITCGLESYNVLCSSEYRIGGMMCKQIIQDIAPLIEFGSEEFGLKHFSNLREALELEGAELTIIT